MRITPVHVYRQLRPVTAVIVNVIEWVSYSKEEKRHSQDGKPDTTQGIEISIPKKLEVVLRLNRTMTRAYSALSWCQKSACIQGRKQGILNENGDWY